MVNHPGKLPIALIKCFSMISVQIAMHVTNVKVKEGR
jgi:hypothetical protein